jgi:hypothetical protein
MVVVISLISPPAFVAASVNQSGLTNSSSFEDNLKSKIQNFVSNVLNDTDNIMNSSFINSGNIMNSSFITNGSNHSSSNIVISSNKIISTMNSNDNDDSSSSMIKNQIKTINGVCSSIKVGGNGNDTLVSSGNCNDEFTGGQGADKFTCGGGNDTIKDYNPKDGDVIVDQQNCEKVE